MTSLINKLLGKDDADHSHGHKTDVKVETSTSSSTHASHGDSSSHHDDHKSGNTQVSEGRTVQHGGVSVKSTIETEGQTSVSLANQQRLTDLVSKLGSTHSQIDSYARNQTEKINEQIQREIDEVVGRIRREQDELLRKANEHTAEIDKDYRARLQAMVEQIDAEKAKRIAQIEVELNHQQADILKAAKNEIDELNKKAARLKIGVLEAAEAKVAHDANTIAAQAVQGQAATIHTAGGSTTIKTEVSGGTTANVTAGGSGSASHGSGDHGRAGGAATVTEAASVTSHTGGAKTVETHHQSGDSRK